MLTVFSRCLSAAGVRFSAILARLGFRPSYDRPTASRSQRTMTGFPRSAHARYDRKGRPLYPGTGGAHAGQVQSPARRLPHHSGLVLYPGGTAAYPGLDLTRHQSRVHVVRPPGLPLARGPPATRELLRLSPGLRTRTSRTRARTPGRGQAQSTSPELRRWPTCQPSNPRVHSHRVRPRVALARVGLAALVVRHGMLEV